MSHKTKKTSSRHRRRIHRRRTIRGGGCGCGLPVRGGSRSRKSRRKSRRNQRRHQSGGNVFSLNPIMGFNHTYGISGTQGVLYGTNMVDSNPTQQNLGYSSGNPRIS
jgi:hypothetical protein